MTKLNCPNCERRRKFIEKEQNKFKCSSCNKEYKQCRIEGCTNVVSTVPVCKECIGQGLKNGGAATVAGLIVVGGFAYRVLKR